MPQFQTVQTIAIGATVANLLTGSPFERVGGLGAHVKVYAVQIDQGVGDLELTLLLGSDVIVQDAGLGLRAAGVIVPDDQIADGDALPGDQITVRIVNTDAVNPVILQAKVDITNV